MPQLTNCPKCHKIVSTDEPTCPSCGLVRPAGGWLASGQAAASQERLDSFIRRGGIALGALAVAAAAAFALVHPGTTETTAPRFTGGVGDRATLKAHAITCPTHDALEKLADGMNKAQAAHDKAGESDTVTRALASGCTTAPHAEDVLVIDLKGFVTPTARVRLEDGSAGWVMRPELKPEQK